MQFDIAYLPGDGIGPEVTAEAASALHAVGAKFGHKFRFHEGLIGGAAIDAQGVALTDDTFDMARGCDAILFGAVGGPQWDDVGGKVPANQGLFRLRKELQIYANLRPVKMLPSLGLRAASSGSTNPYTGRPPQSAGMDIANPLAAILSAALLLW